MSDITFSESKTNAVLRELTLELRNGVTSSNAGDFARRLGGHVEGESARFILWHTKLEEAAEVRIEIFIPAHSLVFDKPEYHANVVYYNFPAETAGPFACSVIDHIPSGNRERFGAFYQFLLVHDDGKQEVLQDPLAFSLPFGIHAPAELYDMERVLNTRKDVEYFAGLKREFDRSGDNRVVPSVNLLEIHTGSVTRGGTLSSLTQRYTQIAKALRYERSLSADEQNLIGFDAVELMPLDPVIEHPENHCFWTPVQTPQKNGDEITIHLRKPDVTNWGYDAVLFGAAAFNPSLLSTGRPHEVLEFIETMHNFPECPKKVVLDVVYGHAHNQALDLLPRPFFAGPNMYGQNINYRHPLVRAILLEMYRRKLNWGFDGVRVDSAQNFRFYDRVSNELVYDNDFLLQLSDTEVETSGVTYKPWMIFEDGRPWPKAGWELSATCRELIKRFEHPSQWAPTIFAHNVPTPFTYWISKWWRIEELMAGGNQWITGYANHDTLRRGSRKDPAGASVNTLLGNSLKMVFENAYNNPAVTLMMNGFLPGVPMDFSHALGSTPWTFVRNTDTEDHTLKIMSEEACFTEWLITDIEFRNSRFFNKTKDFGFESLTELRRFTAALQQLAAHAQYQPENIAGLLNCIDPPFQVKDWNAEKLKQFAGAWMSDLHTYCNVDLHADYLDAKKAAFNLEVRKFRLKNSWLKNNFTPDDMLSYKKPVDGTVIIYGHRRNPKNGQELILVANIEGQSRQVIPSQLGLPVENPEDWNIALSTPSVTLKRIDKPVRLSITHGILFEKKA